jgi:hypothetical protein
VHGNEPSGFFKGGGFIGQLVDYELLKTGSMEIVFNLLLTFSFSSMS